MPRVKDDAAAELVRQQATARHLDNFPKLVAASGVSDATWGRLINHSVFPARTDIRGDMSVGIGWTRDSFDRILRGEPPILTTIELPLDQLGDDAATLWQLAWRLVADLTEVLRQLAEREER